MSKSQFTCLLLILIGLSCSTKTTKPRFQLKSSELTGIQFENNLKYTEDFNPYLYRNFYNGGGVALGDINNDGLIDIYLTGNQVDNKLFLNKGNWKFEDITQEAGVSCSDIWSTGATFADINGDGLLDLYVCKSGKPSGKNRNNELFINNGNLTFSEKSEQYGLNITGLSVHAAFFDFDKDGDLDCYLLNNSIKSVGGFDLIKDLRKTASKDGNKLLINNNGVFEDNSSQLGIYSSTIGFGLGITLSDFNQDSWPDLFVSNDFFEKDYLYTNNKGQYFDENSELFFPSQSMGSMGADAGDLNNDLLTELMVTEMLPATMERKKTKAIYESWDKYTLAKTQGYGHQYPRNVLQRNMGGNTFFEISRITQTDATDWSWGTLFFDFDNDGLKDIFISNGIYKDLLDRDYLNYMSNPNTVKNLMADNEKAIVEMFDVMPTTPLKNVAFINRGNLQFSQQADSLGLGIPSFSNGSAYGDLDNDGDLDLVINNVNMPCFIYENTEPFGHNNFLKIRFNGNSSNTFGIGAKAFVYYNKGLTLYYENYNSHGFQSSTAPELLMGLGKAEVIDSLIIVWPDDQISKFTALKTDTTLTVHQSKALSQFKPITNQTTTRFKKINPLLSFLHHENNTIDFKKEQLLDRMTSNEGPALAIGDLNKDNKLDYFLGGAKGEGGKLFISNGEEFNTIVQPFELDKQSEDTAAIFFDSDNDGDLDLYVCSGGKAFSRFDPALNDRLYINNGNQNFNRVTLPFVNTISSSTVTVADYNNDQKLDIFIGERYDPEAYGAPSSGYVLQNLGQNKFEISAQPELKGLGMITSSQWCNLNGDTLPDLVVAGEWMPVSIFININGTLVNKTIEYGLGETIGIWPSIQLVDIDLDGDLDIIAGNIGANYTYKQGTTLFFNDFDKNGKPESILTQKVNNHYYPIIDKDELVAQLPELKKKLLYYKDYAEAHMGTLFDAETLARTRKVELNTTETSLFLNVNGRFELLKLPQELQYSIVYAIETNDLDQDGNIDILFGGNQHLIKPQFGKLDASRGWVIYGTPNALDFSIAVPEIIGIDGQIRAFKVISHNNKKLLITAVNDSELNFHEYVDQK